MSKENFFISTVIASLILLTLDLLDKFFSNPKQEGEKFKTRSKLFLILVIIVYGIIQYAGLLLVPPTERIIEWLNSFLSTTVILFRDESILNLFGLILLGIVTFYISGFWDYIVHRFLSHSKKLFFTHEYHHLPNELFLALPGLSVRPFVVVAVLPATICTLLTICLGLKIFGFAFLNIMPVIYVIIFIQTIILAATHSSFFVKQKWIHKYLKYLAITWSTGLENWTDVVIPVLSSLKSFARLLSRLHGG